MGAFTRIELLALVAAVALLAAVALSAQSRPREYGQRAVCVNNLRQIARGWLMWASEHGGSAPPIVNAADGGTKGNQNLYAHFLVASNEIGSPTLLVCPSDERQHIAETWARFDSPSFRNNAVGYFAGMHVGFAVNSVATLLAGDPNLQGLGSQECGVAGIRVAKVLPYGPSLSWAATGFHLETGNAAFADGTVAQLTSGGLYQRINLPAAGDGNAEEHILLPP